MSHNGLKLNEDKTEWIIFNGCDISENVTLTVGAHSIVICYHMLYIVIICYHMQLDLYLLSSILTCVLMYTEPSPMT